MAPNSNNGLTVAVIGCGRFGRHYPTVLTEISRSRMPGIPTIDRLVVTATTADRSALRQSTVTAACGDAIPAIVGAAVANTEQLTHMLEAIRPGLVCIAARDPSIGDAIHSEYTAAALPFSPVLCEKPFAPATGDDASVALMDHLAGRFPPDHFGLELPMAVVARAMASDPVLGPALRTAGRIRMHWQRPDPSGTDLISDLALHPWSLLPIDRKIQVQDVCVSEMSTTLSLGLTHRDRPDTLGCDIQLASGGTRRTMQIDEWVLGFTFEGGTVHVVENDSDGRPTGAPPILAVRNPLQQHIEAMLQGAPMVGFDRARKAQAFLEALSRTASRKK